MKKEVILLACLGFFLFGKAQTGKRTFRNGEVFRDCIDCPEMVVIPPGTYLMGATETEFGTSPFEQYMAKFQKIVERPQHKETIRKFAVGKFDITKAQWAAFVYATNRSSEGACAWGFLPEDSAKPWVPSHKANWNHLGFPQDSTHPVVCITWMDAQEYVKWLSSKTGKPYRLLSEAEWEYAARAGTTTAFPWGDSASHEYANYGTDTANGYGYAYGRDKWKETSPVGSFPPNPFGLYDMHGNVLQWVEDCMSDSYHDFSSDGGAYRSKDTLHMKEDLWSFMNGRPACSFHICRGGDAWDSPALIRSAARNWGESGTDPGTNYSSAGLSFRVARSL